MTAPDPTATPTREQWASWLDAVAAHADDPEITHGMRDGLRLAAEHLRSEHCAAEARRLFPASTPGATP